MVFKIDTKRKETIKTIYIISSIVFKIKTKVNYIKYS